MADQPDAHSIIHSRLEQREEYVDATQFLSLFATAEFILQGVFGTIAIVGLSLFYRSLPSPFGVVEHLGAALLALVLVWFIYQRRTRAVLSTVIIFAVLFSIFQYRAVTTNPITKFSLGTTTSSWVAFASMVGLVGFVCYQFIRSAYDLSRISQTERLLIQGKGQLSTWGFARQLFGIPEICAWLDWKQRIISVAMFFLSTVVFSLFVVFAWTALMNFAPSVQYSFNSCLTGQDGFAGLTSDENCYLWLVADTLFLLAITAAELGLAILLVAGSRFLARRFTRLSLERLLSRDTRPLILFLRSFRDDQVRLPKPSSRLLRKLVSLGEPRPTVDHLLLEEGTPHGPVVAIGAPGSSPPFGSARTYVTNDEWRETIAELSRDAGAVVITMDETKGVRWELEHLLGQGHRGKTLFLLPPRLTPPNQVSHILESVFTALGERSEWIDDICTTVRRERRPCIGWFWRDSGNLELLTSLRASSLTYVVAIRTFLNRKVIGPTTSAAIADRT